MRGRGANTQHRQVLDSRRRAMAYLKKKRTALIETEKTRHEEKTWGFHKGRRKDRQKIDGKSGISYREGTKRMRVER